MALGQIEPFSFIVGRQLALNQNVDTSTATRHALVGALLGSGVIGPIVARELARRDAPAPQLPPIRVPELPAPGDKPPAEHDTSNQIEMIGKTVRGWIQRAEALEAQWRDQAAKLEKQARESQETRIASLRQLCEALGSFVEQSERIGEEEPAEAPAAGEPSDRAYRASSVQQISPQQQSG